jgi:hypothetical protein
MLPRDEPDDLVSRGRERSNAITIASCSTPTWSGATDSAVARMRVVATIEDPVVIRKILTHLGLPTEVPAPRPPPRDLFDQS